MLARIPERESVERLLSCLDGSAAPTDDELQSALVSPTVATGLYHWALWALICLGRHLERQRWVGYIVQTRLNGDPQRIGADGALGRKLSIRFSILIFSLRFARQNCLSAFCDVWPLLKMPGTPSL